MLSGRCLQQVMPKLPLLRLRSVEWNPALSKFDVLFSFRFLLGSSRKLFFAVVLFVLLDLSVLLINLWIAHQVAQDAVAINLAGRQRMLSQRITKAALLMTSEAPAAERLASQQELVQAFHLFENTLHAFDKGGMALGGDGQAVALARVNSLAAREQLEKALALLDPIQPDMQQLSRLGRLPEVNLLQIRNHMVRHNLAILDLMNRFTSSMEADSLSRIAILRYVQTAAFLLALGNFFVILGGLVRRQHDALSAGMQWEQAAQRDALTGLYNRLAFDRRFAQAVNKASEGNGTVALLMIDLDDFKPVNDKHGHAMGDLVLKRIAQVLQGVARESDTVARMGGDEFAIFCSNLQDPKALNDLCQRIFQRMEQLTHLAQGVSVRASIGVAVFPYDGRNVTTLLNAADKAMYSSKQQGGQRVTFAAEKLGT